MAPPDAAEGGAGLPARLVRTIRRLPGGTRTEVGGGYAMAVAAVLAVLGYALLVALGTVTIVLAVGGVNIGPFLFALVVGLPSLVASLCAVALPGAFVAGTLVWRWLPTGLPYRGHLGGLLAAGAASVLTGLLMAVVAIGLSLPAVVRAGGHGAIDQLLRGALLYTLGVPLVTGTLTVPIGVLVGAVYEGARTATATG